MTDSIEIGIIGGSGLYDMPELTNREEVAMRTPFGATSDPVIKGELGGQKVAFISRHGRGHRLTPSEVPYAANIYALKTLGVKYLISVSACGSLRQDYQPNHICIPDQVVDWTKGTRRNTFFGEGLVAHVGVADPLSKEVGAILALSADAVGAKIHNGGTFITVEGPRFSTRAESQTFRQLGYSIVGMTTATEAFLAMEAEIAYGVFAHITDYDVWREGEEVSASQVADVLYGNIRQIQQALLEAVPRLANLHTPVAAHSALKNAFLSERETVPTKTLEKLKPIVGKYFPTL